MSAAPRRTSPLSTQPPQGFDPLVERRYQTASYPSAGALLKTFADETQIDPSRTVLGVPGPVHQLPVRAVNLPWLIDPSEISAVLNGSEVHLLNDLQATSYGTLVLKPDDLCPLNEGQRDPQGNIAVIAAGTGLGEGGLCWAEEPLRINRLRGRTRDLRPQFRARSRALAFPQ